MLDEPNDFRRAGWTNGIEISEIVQISETAAQICADEYDFESLSTDVPDFPTPDFFVTAAHDLIVPGTAFSPSGHALIAFAYSRNGLTNGLSRTASALN
jgi:hypothetical protein